MSSIKNLSTKLAPSLTANMSNMKTDSTFENQEQKIVNVVTRKRASKNYLLSCPTDVLLEIMRYLNPPNRKKFQESFPNRPDLVSKQGRHTFENGVYWRHLRVSPPINLPPDCTLEQVWVAAFNKMTTLMQTIYTDENLFMQKEALLRQKIFSPKPVRLCL